MSLRAAFEDILSDENLINPVTDMSETEISEVLEEVQESANEVDKTEEMVEILEEESAALESILETVAAKEDGMTQGEARLFSAAIESIARRCYIPDATRLVPAIESYADGQDRLAASLEAADSGKNILVRMYEAIKAALLKMYNSIKDFFKSFGKSVEALRAGSLNLRKRAEAVIDTGKTKAGKVKAKSFANTLSVDGEFKVSYLTDGKVLIDTLDAMKATTNARKEIVKEIISIEKWPEGTDMDTKKKEMEGRVQKVLGKLQMPGGYTMQASFGRFALKQEGKDFGDLEVDGIAPGNIGTLCAKIERLAAGIKMEAGNAEQNDKAVLSALEKAKTIVNAEGAIAKTKLKFVEMHARWAQSGVAAVPARAATIAKAMIAFGNASCAAAVGEAAADA